VEHNYILLVSFNTGSIFPSKGKIIDEVNSHMECFGFSEKLVLRSERIKMLDISSERELFLEEKVNIAAIYAQQFELKFPGSNPECELVSQ
jgi:hypothetical protein